MVLRIRCMFLGTQVVNIKFLRLLPQKVSKPHSQLAETP